MFECELKSEPCIGPAPDSMQIDIEWLDVAALSQHRFYPNALKEWLAARPATDVPVYLGDVN
jgi:hypothetical protein